MIPHGVILQMTVAVKVVVAVVLWTMLGRCDHSWTIPMVYYFLYNPMNNKRPCCCGIGVIVVITAAVVVVVVVVVDCY
jgi:hypothetical protein